MRIAILGASAGVGLACVQQALARGHEVTSLSRSDKNLPHHERLRILRGSATNAEDVGRALEDADAVLVALGTGKDVKPTTLYTDAMRALLTHSKALVTKPVIVLTGFGAGDSAPHVVWYLKPLFRWLLKDVYANKTAMESMLEASALQWTIVRPGLLTDKPMRQPPRVDTQVPPSRAIGSISREAVADFMVSQAQNPTCLRRKAALSGQ